MIKKNKKKNARHPANFPVADKASRSHYRVVRPGCHDGVVRPRCHGRVVRARMPWWGGETRMPSCGKELLLISRLSFRGLRVELSLLWSSRLMCNFTTCRCTSFCSILFFIHVAGAGFRVGLRAYYFILSIWSGPCVQWACSLLGW